MQIRATACPHPRHTSWVIVPAENHGHLGTRPEAWKHAHAYGAVRLPRPYPRHAGGRAGERAGGRTRAAAEVSLHDFVQREHRVRKTVICHLFARQQRTNGACCFVTKPWRARRAPRACMLWCGKQYARGSMCRASRACTHVLLNHVRPLRRLAPVHKTLLFASPLRCVPLRVPCGGEAQAARGTDGRQAESGTAQSQMPVANGCCKTPPVSVPGTRSDCAQKRNIQHAQVLQIGSATVARLGGGVFSPSATSCEMSLSIDCVFKEPSTAIGATGLQWHEGQYAIEPK